MASRYSVTLAAEDGYSAAFRSFADASRNMEEQIRGNQAELRNLNRVAREMSGYQGLQNDLQATGTALDEAREKQARLAREMRQAEEPSKRLQREYDRATATVSTLSAEHRAQTNELNRLEGSLQSAGVDLSRFADEQRRIEDATRSTNAVLDDQRSRMQAVSDAQARVTAAEGRIADNRAERSRLRGEIAETIALGYIASRPLNSAMNLQTAMADVAKVIDFEEGERERYANANLRLASDRLIASSGMGATDIAAIQYAAGQSGIFNDVSGDERFQGVMDFTRQAAIMAAAFDIDAGQAGSSMVSWRMGMGLDGDQVAQLADATNFLGNSFNTTAADLAEMLTRQGALAVNAGMTPEQAAALGAAFLNPGTDARVAGTGMKNFLLALNQGGAASGKRREAWEELGFAPEDLARRMQQDAPAVIQDVLKAIRALPEEERTGVSEVLFGRESISAISPLLANLDEVDRAFSLTSDQARYTGSMLREAEGVADTSRTTTNVFFSELSRLVTQIGTGMLPVLDAVLPPLTSVVGLLADFTEQNSTLVGVLAAGAAGLIAMKAAVLGVRYAGLLTGQVFNQGALMRARLDQRTAQTALVADGAVTRLNGAIARLAAVGGAAGAGGGRGGRGGRRGAGMGGAAAGAAGGAAAAGAAGRGGAAAAGGWRGTMAGIGNSRAMRWGGRVAMPLALIGGTAGIAHAASDGDAETIGGATGSMLGGMGGWMGGAAGGAALGTMIMPGVGTAVGGAVGGIAGGIAGTAAGQYVGEKAGALWRWAFGDDDPDDQAHLAAMLQPAAAGSSSSAGGGGILGGSSGSFTQQVRDATREDVLEELDERLRNPRDQLGEPGEIAGTINQTNQTDSRVISPTFDIKIEASGNAERDQELLDRLMERLRNELMPLLGAGTSGIDVRLDASLTDRSD
ncbi:phage tail tape measure protein [Spirulina subsalsa FACHB-351]|uniref:Phage tail tape measure protein n=1 Tax=Spirulina subsalsa FACHB-351 TaxID=234711 RepID=A0ABT3L5Q4_9CYAN|nr:phage tail tape measure protein [Spirulina subsalsa]MCW6036832.1 phage tail tape measure protein [Spirulina subsalsa FACHB-351]